MLSAGTPLPPRDAGQPFSGGLVRRLDACWRAALVVAVCCGVSVVVRAPYRHCYFAGDDMNLLAEIGLARCGKLSWLAGWTEVIGPHVMILWKAIFSFEWFAFGLDPFKFHIAIAIVHGLTAAALFWLCRLWPVGLPMAWTASLAWAGAAIGGWDNPTLWIMCGGLTVGLGFFLVAMCFATRASANDGFAKPIAMAVFFALAMLTWSDLALLAPVLLVELAWRGLWRLGWWNRTIWLSAFLTPILAVGPLLGWLVIDEIGGKGRPHGVDPAQVLVRTTGQLAVALGTLTYGQVGAPDVVASTMGEMVDRDEYAATLAPQERLWPKLVLVGLVLIIFAIVRRRIEWRLLSLFLIAALSFLAAANAGGFSMSFRDALNHGHYLYMACLMWSVAAGSFAQAIWPAAARGRVVLTIGGILLLAAFLLHQRQVAASSARIHDAGFSPSTATVRGIESILVRLTQRGADEGEAILLPDVPIGVEAGYYTCWPLAAFAELNRRQQEQWLKIVPLQSCDDQQVRKAIALLRGLGDSEAQRLADTIDQAHPLVKALSWLDREVSRTGQSIQVPDGIINLPCGRVSVQALWRFELTSPSGNPRVQFRDHWTSGQFDQEFPQLARLLRTSTATEAGYLLATFDR
ncbi:MAG: hypothetical protein AB7U73_08900 [Pirellulales bacterium]